MREARSSKSKEYRWRSEEAELISAILGAAQKWGAVEHPQGGQPQQAEQAQSALALPAPGMEVSRTAPLQPGRELAQLVEQLMEELRNQRGEIKELRSLIGQSPPQLPPPHHHRHSWWCKLRHARSDRRTLSA